MSYQTGSYVDANDLLDKIRLKCIEQSWTVNKYEIVGLGYRLHVSKGSVYMNFRSTLNDVEFTSGVGSRYGIAMYLGTGYDGVEDWDNQPGNTYYSGRLLGGFLYTNNGIGEFHIFTLPNAICVYCDSPTYKEQLVFGQTSLDFPIMSASEVIRATRDVAQFRFFLTTPSSQAGIFDNNGANQIVYDGVKLPTGILDTNIISCIDKNRTKEWEIRPLCTDLLINSVNQLRGNSLLIETHHIYYDFTDTEYLGIIEGLFVLTLSGIESYQQITYGAEEYIASYIYPDESSPDNTFGVAALKN